MNKVGGEHRFRPQLATNTYVNHERENAADPLCARSGLNVAETQPYEPAAPPCKPHE
jgi:hypothetical protein